MYRTVLFGIRALAVFDRRHGYKRLLAIRSEPADAIDEQRVEPCRRVGDGDDDGRFAGAGVQLTVGRLDGELHQAPRIPERRFERVAARVAVRIRLPLAVVQRRPDEVLLGAWRGTHLDGIGGVKRRPERVVGVRDDWADGPDAAVGGNGDLLAGVQRDRSLARLQDQGAVEELDDHRAVGLHVDLELRPPDAGRRGLAVDVERRARDEVLDVRESPARLLRQGYVVQAARLREVGGIQADRRLAREPRHRAVGQGDRGTAFRVRLHRVARLQDRAGHRGG